MNTDKLLGIAVILMVLSILIMTLSRCQLNVRVVDSEAVDCTPTLNGEEPDKP